VWLASAYVQSFCRGDLRRAAISPAPQPSMARRMDRTDDSDGPGPPGDAKSDVSGASREREARLAAALRANLRKRKMAPGTGRPGGR